MIAIVAALVRDEAGRVLLVRKEGTTAFMQPGGKRDPGEDDLTTLARELDEELGCGIVPGSARLLGRFEAAAANEAGRRVDALVYEVELTGTPRPRAEIAEMAWVEPNDPRLALAPLTSDHILPLARRLTVAEPG
jgi:8-oxo-dGTP diphosphatase